MSSTNEVVADSLFGLEFCKQVTFTSSEKSMMSNAFVYNFYETYFRGCVEGLWGQWVGTNCVGDVCTGGWWQTVQAVISAPWILPTIGIITTVSNVLLVSFQTTGFNNIAVFA